MGRGALSLQNEDPTPQDGWEKSEDFRHEGELNPLDDLLWMTFCITMRPISIISV